MHTRTFSGENLDGIRVESRLQLPLCPDTRDGVLLDASTQDDRRQEIDRVAKRLTLITTELPDILAKGKKSTFRTCLGYSFQAAHDQDMLHQIDETLLDSAKELGATVISYAKTPQLHYENESGADILFDVNQKRLTTRVCRYVGNIALEDGSIDFASVWSLQASAKHRNA